MKSTCIHILAVVVLMLSVFSCGKHGRIMSRSVLEDVYVDLFLADQWLSRTKVPGQQKASDTTMFYEPVFRKYGYTTEDFVSSVNYYLHDSKRYSRILRKAESRISDRAAYLRTVVAEGDEIERLYEVIRQYDHGLKLYYDTVYMNVCRMAGLVVKADSAGRYLPFIPQELLDSLHYGDSLRLDSLLRDSLLMDSLRLETAVSAQVVEEDVPRKVEAPAAPERPTHPLRKARIQDAVKVDAAEFVEQTAE